MKKRLTNRLFVRFSVFQIIMTVFVISILSLSVLFAVMINAFYQSNRSAMARTMQVECDFLAQDIEQSINAIYLRQCDLLNDETVLSLSFPAASSISLYESYKNIQGVKYIIRSVDLLNNYIGDVKIYYPEKGIVISSMPGSNWYNKLTDVISLEELEAISKNEIELRGQEIWVTASSVARTRVVADGKAYMLPQIIIESDVSMQYIQEKMLSYGETIEGKSILLLNSADRAAMVGQAPRELTEAELLDRLEQGEGHGPARDGLILAHTAFQTSDLILAETVRSGVLFDNADLFRVFIPLLLLLMAVVITAFLGVLYTNLHAPIKRLCRALDSVQNKNFDKRLKAVGIKDMDIVFDSFNRMAAELKEHIDSEYKSKMLVQEAQLKQLELQINPHFLYNSFFIVQGMLEEELYEEANQMTGLLGIYLRYIVKNKNPVATLEDEDTYARAFADIQQIRFKRSLSLIYEELPEEIRTLPVPRLIIQPLIENAVIHGWKGTKPGTIRVRYEVQPELIQICVEDSGDESVKLDLKAIDEVMRDSAATSNGIALYNIHTRLKLMFGEDSGLFAQQSELGGLSIKIRIRRVQK